MLKPLTPVFFLYNVSSNPLYCITNIHLKLWCKCHVFFFYFSDHDAELRRHLIGRVGGRGNDDDLRTCYESLAFCHVYYHSSTKLRFP